MVYEVEYCNEMRLSIVGLFCNEARKDFTKSERIDYARRLERIESLKAKERMSDGGKGCQISDNLRTDDYVSEKLGIGSRDTYRKEKYIVENQESLSHRKILLTGMKAGFQQTKRSER